MTMNRTPWIVIAVVVVLAGIALLAVRFGDDAAPAFRLERLSGGRFYLREHHGKCVVLLFWSTTCAPCKREMRFLEALRRDLADERLVIAAICVDADTHDQARNVTEPLGLDYPILLDRGGQVARAWHAKTLPTTVIVDPQGRTAWRREGYDPAAGRLIRSQIERLLAGAEAAP